MSIIVGAYAASPSGQDPWDANDEAAFMAGLRDMESVGGLEIGYYDDLHRHDAAWLLRHLKADWRYLVTSLPGTMNRLAVDPRHGLASTDDAGRKSALDYAEKIRASIQTLNDHCQEQVVKAVILHAAPRNLAPAGSLAAERLFASLAELADRDWHGAELWLEHCDSPSRHAPPAKGFLRLEDEIAVVSRLQGTKTKLGMLINWGRSALETRNPETPREHIAKAKAQNVLKGVMFSGCTEGDDLYGHWQDSHAPFAPSSLADGRSSSLMTVERAAACLQAGHGANDLEIGIKIQALPATMSVPDRLKLIADSLLAVEDAKAKA